MATVVVVLALTARVSSMPTLRSLSGSSVRSGLISLIAPTKVVFPTPKPPAMRNLAVAGALTPAPAPLERLKSIKHHPQQALVGLGFALCGQDAQQSLVDQVAEQHADHPDGKIGLRGKVDDGLGPLAELHDPAVLGSWPEVRPRPFPGRRHDVDQPELRSARRPALRHRVRPDHRAGLRIEPAVPVLVTTRAGHEPCPSRTLNPGSSHRQGTAAPPRGTSPCGGQASPSRRR